MTKLIKANLKRLFRNGYYIAGCVLAAAITAFFCADGQVFSVLRMSKTNDYMIFISAGVPAFFSTFTTIFINTEYNDGVIRNKLIAGHSQKEVYISHLITQVIAGMIMILCWFAGGVAGGASVDTQLLAYIFIMIFYNLGYISVLTALGMHIRKKIFSSMTGVVLLHFLINGFLMGNAVISFTEGIVSKIVSIIYHISPLGQWFANTCYGKDCRLSIVIELLLSTILIIVMYALGTRKINEREIK